MIPADKNKGQSPHPAARHNAPAIPGERESLQVALASIRDAIIITDVQARVTFLNPVAETMTGWKAAEAQGQPLERVFNIINDQTRQPAMDPVSRVLREGTATRLANHTVLIARDGRERVINDRATPILDAAGNIRGVALVFHDVTDERRAEKAIADSDQRLRLAMDAGELGDWSWDAHTKVMTLSVRAAAIYGLPTKTPTIWQWGELRQLLHEDDRERARATVEEAMRTRTDYRIEYRLKSTASGERWIAARGRGIYETDGTVAGMVGVVQDITERKQAEEVSSRLTAIIDHSDDAVISKDLNGIIRSWNQGAERIFGYAAHEVIGQPVTILIPPNRHNEEPEIIGRIRRGDRVDHYETVRRRKDGTLIDVSLTVSPVKDGSGKIIGASKIGREITERKKAEAALSEAHDALARQNQALDQTVQQRTAILQETILELEAFSYSISHDMRAPLRAMQGYSDALLKDYQGNLDPQAVFYLERIRCAAARLDLLIRDVLAYSRIAKEEVRLRPIKVEGVIGDIVQNYPNLHPNNIRVIVSSIPPVLAHESLLTQIISNLLGNALKFATPGVFPEVRIHAEPLGADVKIWFADNGVGIEPQYHQRIFQIFGRVYPEKLYEGTGIGLAIVKKAAERMGGTAGINSESGKGSQFWITLKRAI